MSLDSLTLSETKVFERDLSIEQTKNVSISFKQDLDTIIQEKNNAKIANAIFGFTIANNEYSVSISDITTTTPTSGSDGLTLKSRLEAAKIKANTFLSSKTVTLTKHLDAYGVIDSIIKDKKDNKISARIYNIADHEFVDEVIFLSKEFSESDQRKLVENAIFYWHVGVEKNIFGREKHVSEFRLRRVAKR